MARQVHAWQKIFFNSKPPVTQFSYCVRTIRNINHRPVAFKLRSLRDLLARIFYLPR